MNRVALITGGSRGIGLGIARELARLKFSLVINGVRPESAVNDTLSSLRELGSEVIYCSGNIALKEDRERMIAATMSQYGKLNVLVNNAGVAPKDRLDLLETTEESFDHIMNINLKGSFFLTQQVASYMATAKQDDPEFEGCIINITSVSAQLASVNRGEYCISKSGLSMMSKLFATRMGEYGIPVYEVQPGIIKTDMTAAVLDKYGERVKNGLTIQPRLGQPEDVGKAVASLATGQLPYATGQVITIDGGITTSRL